MNTEYLHDFNDVFIVYSCWKEGAELRWAATNLFEISEEREFLLVIDDLSLPKASDSFAV